MTRSQDSENHPTAPSVNGQDAASIALTISKQLINIFNSKRLLNLEAGLESITLGVIICSMVLTLDIYCNYLSHFVLECWQVSRNRHRCKDSVDKVWNWSQSQLYYRQELIPRPLRKSRHTFKQNSKMASPLISYPVQKI